MNNTKRLTEYSHGSGCGCKIAPNKLEEILNASGASEPDSALLVGIHTGDDAAVIEYDAQNALISTTDFFTPIVDDPYEFGRIASCNALSDVYAMGGTPIMAVSILGWPVEKLSTTDAAAVIRGARSICKEAGISLAGGHSIDAPEPFFGLAITGRVEPSKLKRNSTAKSGDRLYLTKPIGSGIIATAIKRGKVRAPDADFAISVMSTLNKAGLTYGAASYVNAMTDVTGFGLAGHLIEMCEGAGLSAVIRYDMVPLFPDDMLSFYLEQFIFPDNSFRNFSSYGSKVSKMDGRQLQILCDPQTNGGLLVAVDPGHVAEFEELSKRIGQPVYPIGEMTDRGAYHVIVE